MNVKEFVGHLTTKGYSPKKTSKGGWSMTSLYDPEQNILDFRGLHELAVAYYGSKGDTQAVVDLTNSGRQIIKEVLYQLGQYTTKKTNQTKAQSRNFCFQDTALALDIITNEYFLYSKSKKEVLVESPDAYLSILDTSAATEAKQNVTLAKIEYNPYIQKRVYGEAHRDDYVIPVFNSYIPPKWTKKEVVDPRPPEFFFKFLEHLFPERSSREYALRWIRNVLTGRNETMLCLITDPGTGKNTLSIICQKLVGDHNFYKPRDTFFNSQFNSELSAKKLIYFDEVCISLRNKEVLKSLMNDTISIEKKGVDPIMKANYASYLLANNIKNGNRIESKDRRFSIPDATNSRLLDVFNEEHITNFIEDINNPDSIALANIGHWILNKVDISAFTKLPFKGKTFTELSQLSLWDWEKFLVEKIFSREESSYSWSEIKAEFTIQFGGGAKFAGPSHTKLFLSSYVDPEGDEVATTEQDGTDLKIIPSKKYSKIIPEFEDFDIFS